VQRRALPEFADFAQQAELLWQSMGTDAIDALRHGFEQAQAAGASALDLWPAAHAEDPASVAEAATAAAEAATTATTTAAGVVLDPNTKYVMGLDGNVLVDPMNNKPLVDDWWNGFIGLQAGFLKDIDRQLRAQGVTEAFGWSIVIYTCLVKVLFYPLQQSQLRSTSMMQLLQPKVKDIQDKYKNDPETMSRLLGQLYTVMDVNPLGGCLPVFLQLPVFWSLYGVWRRLSAEKFEHYEEGWLWVPSLAKPNPDFQFKFDWLLEFTDGAPTMGWHDYLCYLVFPVLLVSVTVISQQQAQAARPKGKDMDDSQQLLLQVLPLVSVYFIGTLSLELPQAVSLYYSVNTGLSLAQTQLVKYTLRQEIPGYAEFEKTGKFPDGAFEDMVRSSTPPPKTLHEACTRGDEDALKELLEAGTSADGVPLDVNAWDEKQIAPLGYAVATGNPECARLLIARGANLQIVDGQKNTLLHYAAGYGQLSMLKELLSNEVFQDGAWKEQRNNKKQTVVDAARVNRKGQVLDYLKEEYGLEPEVPLPPPPAAAPAASPSSENAAARAALLAAAGGSQSASAVAEPIDVVATEPAAPAAEAAAAAAAAGMPGGAGRSQEETARVMQDAITRLKANPEAVEQARKMMGKMPPQLLSMLSGNKMSAEDAKKAMDAMQNMTTEDLLDKAGVAADKLSQASPAAAQGAAPSPGGAPARVVD